MHNAVPTLKEIRDWHDDEARRYDPPSRCQIHRGALLTMLADKIINSGWVKQGNGGAS